MYARYWLTLHGELGPVRRDDLPSVRNFPETFSSAEMKKTPAPSANYSRSMYKKNKKTNNLREGNSCEKILTEMSMIQFCIKISLLLKKRKVTFAFLSSRGGSLDFYPSAVTENVFKFHLLSNKTYIMLVKYSEYGLRRIYLMIV